VSDGKGEQEILGGQNQIYSSICTTKEENTLNTVRSWKEHNGEREEKKLTDCSGKQKPCQWSGRKLLPRIETKGAYVETFTRKYGTKRGAHRLNTRATGQKPSNEF